MFNLFLINIKKFIENRIQSILLIISYGPAVPFVCKIIRTLICSFAHGENLDIKIYVDPVFEVESQRVSVSIT